MSAERAAAACADALTRLPLREAFFQELERCWRRAREADRRVAVLLIKMSRLRRINMSFGYDSGDQVLVQLAARIRGVLREADYLARVGDGEFAVIIPEALNTGHAILAANKIVQVTDDGFQIDGRHVRVPVTIGIAVAPDHAGEPAKLLEAANAALALTGTTGKRYQVYVPERIDDDPATMLVEADLLKAVDNGELRLVFQPKVDLASGRVVGAEALTRWDSPLHGSVPPDLFIRVAEECGLINPITAWTFNAGIRHVREFAEIDPGFSIAVNLSATLLHDPDLQTLITNALEIWGVPAGQLTVEITESATMADPDASLATLRRLAQLGIQIAIDDFGTGYSSLAYLKRLPVSELKIDKVFVANMNDSEDDVRIVQSIIDLAHNFGLRVVAEGAEDWDTVERLQAMACDYVQGYVVSRPLEDAALTEFMRETAGLLPNAPR